MADVPLLRFAPGDGTAFVAADRIALTAGHSDSATARALRALVAREAPLADAMTELSRLGFAALDTFAVVVAEHDARGDVTARVLHRGDIAVRIERAGGAAVLHQPQLATWREEVVDGARSVRVDLGASSASALMYWADGPAELPATSVSWVPSADSASVAVAGEPVEPIVVDHPVAAAPTPLVMVPDASPPVVPTTVPDDVSPVPTASEPEAAPSGAVEVADANDEALVLPTIETGDVGGAVLRGIRPPGPPDVEPASPTPPPPGEADDIDFANLVHHTVFRSPEDAAIRAADERQGVPPTLPPPAHGVVAIDAAFPGADPSASDETRAWLDGAPARLISGVPPPSASPPVPGATPLDLAGPVRAVPDSDQADSDHADSDHADSDHDGHTVARRPPRGGGSTPAAPVPETGRPMVHAVRCPSGHLNPPSAPSCRVCAAPIADRNARTAPRPQLGVVRFSTGQTALIDGPLMIGRNPPTGVELDGERATAVAIDDSEISRSHVALYVADWYVSVEDQGSTNGTVVHVPGKPDQTLRPFERVQLMVGTVVDIGGAVTFRYEVT